MTKMLKISSRIAWTFYLNEKYHYVFDIKNVDFFILFLSFIQFLKTLTIELHFFKLGLKVKQAIVELTRKLMDTLSK